MSTVVRHSTPSRGGELHCDCGEVFATTYKLDAECPVCEAAYDHRGNRLTFLTLPPVGCDPLSGDFAR